MIILLLLLLLLLLVLLLVLLLLQTWNLAARSVQRAPGTKKVRTELCIEFRRVRGRRGSRAVHVEGGERERGREGGGERERERERMCVCVFH